MYEKAMKHMDNEGSVTLLAADILEAAGRVDQV